MCVYNLLVLLSVLLQNTQGNINALKGFSCEVLSPRGKEISLSALVLVEKNFLSNKYKYEIKNLCTPLKEKFSLPISIFPSLLPHPQRELLVVSLTNKRKKLSPPLKEKFSLPISIFHSLLPHPQRELLVVSLKNLSPPSKRSSLCLFQFFTLSYPTLNERFSLSR